MVMSGKCCGVGEGGFYSKLISGMYDCFSDFFDYAYKVLTEKEMK